jgi:hypothetical protein
MMGAMSTATIHGLTVIGRSSTGQPRTFRVQRPPDNASRNGAYRRLVAAILGVDVPTLATELRAQRLTEQPSVLLAA